MTKTICRFSMFVSTHGRLCPLIVGFQCLDFDVLCYAHSGPIPISRVLVCVSNVTIPASAAITATGAHGTSSKLVQFALLSLLCTMEEADP